MTITRFLQNPSRLTGLLYRKWLATTSAKQLHIHITGQKFARAYLVISLIVLFGTTLFWGLLGARLQQSNADQLVSAYLFQDGRTFHGAVFPDQHSFLIKWPLFFIVKLFGYSSASFIGVTLVIVLLTIGMLVFLLSRINRQPVILGTICLALASVLLLIPAQPYPGGLLPVNMAMSTTRNLEYILYIVSLYYLVKAPRLKSKQFYTAVGLLSLLIASDKLFLYMSLGGAVLALVSYASYKNGQFLNLSRRWFIAAIGGGLGATALIKLINYTHLTHIGTQAVAGLGPFGLAHGLKAIGLGGIYAVTGLLTNFGANPAYDSITIQQIPHKIIDNMNSAARPAYVINLCIFLFGLVICSKFLLESLRFIKPKKNVLDRDTSVAILLLWTTLSAIGLFVVTDHYYLVDGRYITIALFTMFVVLATRARRKQMPAELLLGSVLLLGISIVSGSLAAVNTYKTQKRAVATIDHRNEIIGQAITSHRVNVLVGDYWRVIPAKSATSNKQTVLPLAQCFSPRKDLTSTEWQPDLRKRSFAYLLTLDGSLTGYPHCTFQQIAAAYGLPNSSALIAGTLSNPKELLLFYYHGINRNSTMLSGKSQLSPPVLPISLADLPRANCRAPSIMHVVAHQDDDLLFMNPDLLHDIKAGHCISSVYLTAGDAGAGSHYWLSREQGSEAAYSQMLGSSAVWVQHIVRLPGGQFITVANPSDNNAISLIFMHLPDGNLRGEGFGISNYESLASLETGKMSRIETVDHQSTYDSDQLIAGLTNLVHTYKPAEIRTLSNYSDVLYPDHSDHITTGHFAGQANKQYAAEEYGSNFTVPIKFYIGYPVHQFAPNVSEPDLLAKENAFLAYSAFDGGVCRSLKQCQKTSTYGNYLDRQYRNPD